MRLQASSRACTMRAAVRLGALLADAGSHLTLAASWHSLLYRRSLCISPARPCRRSLA